VVGCEGVGWDVPIGATPDGILSLPETLEPVRPYIELSDAALEFAILLLDGVPMNDVHFDTKLQEFMLRRYPVDKEAPSHITIKRKLMDACLCYDGQLRRNFALRSDAPIDYKELRDSFGHNIPAEFSSFSDIHRDQSEKEYVSVVGEGDEPRTVIYCEAVLDAVENWDKEKDERGQEDNKSCEVAGGKVLVSLQPEQRMRSYCIKYLVS
jgi:hypothetical protein